MAHLAKHNVLAVQMHRRVHHDGKVALGGVWSGVRHRQQALAIMLQLQALWIILELPPVDTICPGASLVNEAINDPIERIALQPGIQLARAPLKDALEYCIMQLIPTLCTCKWSSKQPGLAETTHGTAST